jgi:hypothetical protein
VKEPAEQKDIRRATRRQFSAEDEDPHRARELRGEESIAELCRRERIVQNIYYRWSKDFLVVSVSFRFVKSGIQARSQQLQCPPTGARS